MTDPARDMATIKNVIQTLRDIYDPELPVSIYDLGLIYEINLQDPNIINVVMTLTSPNCPVAQTLPVDVKTKLEEIDGVEKANIEIVFEPPWTPEKMSEAAKLEMNLL